MYKKVELNHAIKIQKISYDFLMWLTQKTDKGEITFSNAHEGETESWKIVHDWITAYYDFIPERFNLKKKDLIDFSRYFSTYVTTSFDFDERMMPKGSGCKVTCYCPLCLTLMPTLLHIKKTTKHDKFDAIVRQSEVVQALAKELKIQISYQACRAIATDKKFQRDTAYIAYTNSLLERIKGNPEGTYVLILWRKIAWNAAGSPIKGFELKADNVLFAAENVKNRLEELQDSSKS